MDTHSALWFKRKRYGWGWTPVTWQGWVTIFVYIILVIGNAVRTIDAPSILPFILQTVGLSFVVLFICFKKGETPKWQWGEEETTK